ncbi:MAG TPA: response regulator, partial [Thermoanaerobaculia bacterium]
MAGLQKRILIVEDDGEVRAMIGSALRQRGLTVDEAPGGQEAIDLVRENRYAVILLDLLMPHPDGFAVLDELDSPQSLPVVLVVIGADRSVIDQLDSQRIHGVVRKPFDPDDLAALVVACSEIRARG